MSEEPTRIAIHGALGRMGRELMRHTAEDPTLRVCAALERDGAEPGRVMADVVPGAPAGLELSSDLQTALERVDVVVDFTHPVALAHLAQACLTTRTPLVTGTTGLHRGAEAALDALAQQVPVVAAPNFSQGVTLLFHLAAEAARRLGPAFDAEIVEVHHRRKVDAPSGTAARLAEVVAEAKQIDPASGLVHGRSGEVGARPRDEVGVLSLRAGDVVGEHTLMLAGAGERLELTHRATDRGIFALGALRAARWACEQVPGRYDMADVMGLISEP